MPMPQDKHLQDQELLAWLDGELEPADRAHAGGHLEHCWTCRARKAELEQTIHEYAAWQLAAGGAAPPAAGPTARLRAQLQQARGETPATWRQWTLPLAVGGALLTGLAFAIVWLGGQRSALAGPLPDPQLTPGATRLISREQVCALSSADEGRRIPASLALQVFEKYGMGTPKSRAYEVDYLISPALGGAEDIRNLWPQPYEDGVWTARVKDALEDHLRQLVCDGKMELPAAQEAIAKNWIAAYQRTFRTTKPIAAHALFVKDAPWE